MKILKILKVIVNVLSLARLRKKKENKSRYDSLDYKDLKLLGLGSLVLEEYIKSRKFRRLFKNHDVDAYIKQMLIEWGEVDTIREIQKDNKNSETPKEKK